MFEAFAGIGSQYKALKNIAPKKEWSIKVVGMIEWYLHAIIAYAAIHSPSLNAKAEQLLNDYPISSDSKTLMKNIGKAKLNNSLAAYYLNKSKNDFNNVFNIEETNWSNIPSDIDIFTYSFPCQDLSSQGLQKGINKDLKTRSGLLWNVEKILIDMKANLDFKELPKYLLMENVKHLTSTKNIKNYHDWIKSLEEIGYVSQSYLLNAKNFNLPQNRARVFLISVRKDHLEKVNFSFPDLENQQLKKYASIKKILDERDDSIIDIPHDSSPYRKTGTGVIKKELYNFTNFNSENFIFNIDGIGPTLTASGANSRIKIEYQENKYRYLNALECLKYMGFSKEDYLKIKKTKLISDNKIIFLSGNSIPVNVLEAIFSSFKFEGDK